jgi:hypothetical protein
LSKKNLIKLDFCPNSLTRNQKGLLSQKNASSQIILIIGVDIKWQISNFQVEFS